ncbi:MAG: hypothetical protein SV487_08140 [Thermodesulfobacteriota bacterium]|nr:hypothetical protein [Thermodesulfobacteriota bacterium]
MRLSERLQSGKSWSAYGEKVRGQARLDRQTYNSIKSLVHFRLVEQLDPASITDLPRDALTASIRDALHEITAAENVPLNHKERTLLVSNLMNEILGFGPIEPLIEDDGIQDILVNGHDQVFIEKDGLLSLTPIKFRDNDHLMQNYRQDRFRGGTAH